MPRGFDWAVYVDDTDARWALTVDSDYVQDADRGWALLGDEVLPPFPRGWRARRVVGVDVLGATVFALAGTRDCYIWTTPEGFFVFETSAGALQTASIIARQAERRLPRPH